MVLDNYLTFKQKIYISLIACGIWIYFRTDQCYAMIPRKSLFSVLLITIWVYLNYYDPLAAPIGLCILYLYSISLSEKNKEED
jgi:hypothetical protein